MERTPDELRQQAREIRNNAQHAERLADVRIELNQAAQLEALADQMEGKVPTYSTPTADRELLQAKQKAESQRRIDEAIGKIERRLGQVPPRGL